MRVTIIPEDRWIRRDNDQAKLPDWPFDDATIHAIQWLNSEGEIEYKGQPKPVNEVITDYAIIEPYLAAYDAYLASLALEPESAPIPEPPVELTTEQKLEAAGLSVAELKTLFGLT
jgi:hypothetical protein